MAFDHATDCSGRGRKLFCPYCGRPRLAPKPKPAKKPVQKAKTERNEEMLSRYLAGETKASLGRRYGISSSQVAHILWRQSRRHKDNYTLLPTWWRRRTK